MTLTDKTKVEEIKANEDNPPGANKIGLLREAVLKKRPVLREIIEKRGAKSLFKYADEYADVNLNDLIIDRQKEVLFTFQKEVAERLGEKVAEAAAKQLKKFYFISTADHHGPICHSFFLNSNLVTSICGLSQSPEDINYIIVFSCANVSFANSSFPRGLLFHSYANGNLKLQQLGLFPNTSRIRQARVFGHAPYGINDVARLEQRLAELRKNKEVSPEIGDKILSIVRRIYARPEALGAKNYSDQITKTNFLLWQKFFSAMEAKGPDLLYIELESMVSSLLIDHHLSADTIIHRVIFSLRYAEIFTKYFDGIEGGFSLEKDWGTYLFWALPPGARYSQKMRRQGNFLVTTDGSYKLELKPEEIRRALIAREIFPGTQLSLLVLSLYYGLKCLGGFCQVNYLTDMRHAYEKMLVEVGSDYGDLSILDILQTKELGEDLTIAFLEAPNGAVDLATGLDLFLYGDEQAWPILVEGAKKITVAEALSIMMPDFYHIMYPEAARDPSLTRIKAGDIMKHNGLGKKISPCVKIKN